MPQKKIHPAMKYLETKILLWLWKQIHSHKQYLEKWISKITQVVSTESYPSTTRSNTKISKFCCYFAFLSFFHWETVSMNSCIQIIRITQVCLYLSCFRCIILREVHVFVRKSTVRNRPIYQNQQQDMSIKQGFHTSYPVAILLGVTLKGLLLKCSLLFK